MDEFGMGSVDSVLVEEEVFIDGRDGAGLTRRFRFTVLYRGRDTHGVSHARLAEALVEVQPPLLRECAMRSRPLILPNTVTAAADIL